MLDVQALSKLYGDFPAVQGLTFAVAAGEVLGLVGPNGAGKTTTLRSLAGILAPSAGRIVISGHDLAREPLRAKAALAFIPDEPQLFDYLTVEEHLRFVGRLYGVSDAVERIGPLLEEMELMPKRHTLASQLSRGMKQKLAIGCGLLHRPGLLLLDEPLTGLDPGGIRRMKATISTRAREGTAVVLSSHLLHLVEELCTRVLILHNGHLVALGTVSEIVVGRPNLEGRGLEDIFLALTGGEGSASS